jgi:hypothetical protein
VKLSSEFLFLVTINRLEQERFLTAMMQQFLSASEQAGIQKICQQIQQG